jgi:hypothetical protein
MANESIKNVIRDFFNFDIENDYYKEEDKDNLVKMFKEMLEEDDTTVRQFLKSLFDSGKDLANQYSLIANEGEVVEEPMEEPEDAMEEPEDAGEEPEDAGEEPEDAMEEPSEVPESYSIYRKIASNLLYE